MEGNDVTRNRRPSGGRCSGLISFCQSYNRFLAQHWKGIVVFLTPLIFLPVLLLNLGRKEYRCMYILFIMAIYWVTEALPLPITSMIPIVAFPLAGIMDSEQTCRLYFKDTLVMFLGGIMMALAIEYCNLHKRLALRVIQIVGCSPRRLHFGLIFVTMFISMWINNAAATAMMCPIIQAVLQELQAQGLCKMYEEKDYSEANCVSDSEEKETIELNNKHVEDGANKNVEKKEDEPLYPSKIAICFYLGTAYAASMGGCGTLIGTATNLTFKGIYEGKFKYATDTLDFPTFMFYSVPSMLVYTLLMYLWMQWMYMGLWRPKSKEAQEANIGEGGAEIARRVIDQRYKELGPMSCHEVSVLGLFIALIVLYFTRKPGIFTGWADVLDEVPIKNSAPTMLIVILCFVLPSSWVFLKFWSRNDTATSSLISWKFIQQKVPWGLIFLLGGGFALAEGSDKSGMAEMVGNSLIGLKGLPLPVLLLIVIIVAEVLTEFSSNVAICNIILPVLVEISRTIEVHPLYLMLPAGLACSMAFHLPVATPPNALVGGYANIKTKDMATAGIGPTIISIIVLFVFCQTWGLVIYPDLTSFPDWARRNYSQPAAEAILNGINSTSIGNITDNLGGIVDAVLNATANATGV